MKLTIDRITESPAPFSFEVSPQWWLDRFGADGEMGGALVGPLALDLCAHRMGEELLLEGAFTGELEVACGRCLTRYRAPVREGFRLVLEPAGTRVPADPEGAASLERDGLYLGDELETGWFRGSEIRLDRFLQEVMALVFPVQPLCREDCRGLCPQCGKDRNLESCECAEPRPASPFAALEALRDRVR